MRKWIIVVIAMAMLWANSCQRVVEVASPTPRATVIPTPTPKVTPQITELTFEEFMEMGKTIYCSICFSSRSFEDLIIETDIIAAATLQDIVIHEIDPLNGSDPYYRYCFDFKITSLIKGDYTEDTIRVSMGYNQLKEYHRGSSYIMLIYCYDSVYRDKPCYDGVRRYVMEITEDVRDLDRTFKDTAEFASYANDIFAEHPTPSPTPVPYTLSIYPDEIIDYSDTIVEATAQVETFGYNKYTFVIVHMQVNKLYKGDIHAGDTIVEFTYPYPLEDGGSYLLLLDGPRTCCIASPYGCVNLNETERYQQYMDYLEDLAPPSH